MLKSKWPYNGDREFLRRSTDTGRICEKKKLKIVKYFYMLSEICCVGEKFWMKE
jgi:hypothetical protein